MVGEFDLLSQEMRSKLINFFPFLLGQKENTGKTYWIYSPAENVETHEEKIILQVRLFITLAKKIKRRDVWMRGAPPVGTQSLSTTEMPTNRYPMTGEQRTPTMPQEK